MESVLQKFGISADALIIPITSGIINKTWKVSTAGGNFILQQINDDIFLNPQLIHDNIAAIATYLKKNYSNYIFPSPIMNSEGSQLFKEPGVGYFRVFPFIEGTHTIDVVSNPKQAFEAAEQFGRFTAYLGGFNCNQLNVTIPNFHNLSYRYQQFQEALKTGNHERIQGEKNLIDKLTSLQFLVKQYEAITKNQSFKKRVTHHDTKISNVLFNKEDNSVCIIDLDTVMPGYFISDIGDMMRTYLCEVSENEEDISKIKIRPDYYFAIVEGYYKEMQNELTSDEKKHFFFAGQFMIYMQALRFLTDYLNNDIYYQIQYPTHNLVRAINQVVLLERLMDYEIEFKKFKL